MTYLLVGVPALGLCLVGGEALAQSPYPGTGTVNSYAPPAYSPYLNLLRSGNPGINYLGLVRPQVDVAANIQQLQRQSVVAQQNISALEASSGEVVTGQHSQFMNYSRYFLNNAAPQPMVKGPSTAASNGRSGGARTAPSPH